MPQPIEKYHVLDFGSIKGATRGAAALIEYSTSQRGLRHMTGPLRAVVWGETPSGSPLQQAWLYVSEGGLAAAKELKLAFEIVGSPIPAAEVPTSCTLLLGEPTG